MNPLRFRGFSSLLLVSPLVTCLFFSQITMAEDNQVLELRTYTLVDAAAETVLDAYLQDALIPALARQGLGPIGVLDQASEAEDGSLQVILLIPGPSTEAVTGASAKLAKDQEYLRAAAGYLSIPADKPIVSRIRSELLLSFDCWPQVTVSKQKQAGKDRLFELRVYESPTEKFGELKVEMFNSGEVPIFLDCGIEPVFMGQALIGDSMPNLTYMTVYDDNDARTKGWENFRQHADWQVLKAVEKYQGAVSKIHKSDWKPKSYSQL